MRKRALRRQRRPGCSQNLIINVIIDEVNRVINHGASCGQVKNLKLRQGFTQICSDGDQVPDIPLLLLDEAS